MVLINADELHQTAGQRLEAVVLKHFVKQKLLADKVGVTPNNISMYISGKNTITKKFAMQLQDLAGINADYILNGKEPMMLEDVGIENSKPYQTIYDGPVPITIKKKTLLQHGYVKQYFLSSEGKKHLLQDNHEGNVVNSVLGGANEQRKFMIVLISSDFCEYYNLQIGTILIIDEEYSDGDIVLVSYKQRYHFARYENNKLIGKKTKDSMEIVEGMEILGSVFRKIDKIL
jgi:plasmid maintenance system antidote protein VapI